MGEKEKHSFSHFLDEPHVATAFLVLGLVALMLAVLEFSKTMSYFPY